MEKNEALSDEARSEIERLLRDGRKIDAIKVYREDAGVGLAEAKSEVEKIEHALLVASGGDVKPIRPSSGCAVMVFTVALTTLLLAVI